MTKKSLFTDKLIWDPTCGGRTIWFQKEHPLTLYTDIREADKGINPRRPNFCVKPDQIVDFRKTEFPNNHFKLIVWDPPHLKLGENAIMRKYYGSLSADTWRKGFNEMWRVLDNNGVLIFKWNTEQFPLKDVLACFHTEPLFGHTTGSKSKTLWMAFMKVVE